LRLLFIFSVDPYYCGNKPLSLLPMALLYLIVHKNDTLDNGNKTILMG